MVAYGRRKATREVSSSNNSCKARATSDKYHEMCEQDPTVEGEPLIERIIVMD